MVFPKLFREETACNPSNLPPSCARSAGLALAGAAFGISLPAQAQETTLRLVSAFAENGYYVLHLQKMDRQVQRRGQGNLQINFMAARRRSRPLKSANAVKTGVVDIGPVHGAFYTT